ncbi:Orn/Lys/Arg family decarboxylase [Parafrankia discariae]|uniref:Orn/Lys/Arg family decarboxylase n=1 Tax=Parafrankia discariae TaxID=365528 RepID=UPI001E4D086D|nr:hypothetical protein [Parafrankia discariae]
MPAAISVPDLGDLPQEPGRLVTMSAGPEAPLADALADVARRGRHHNFHALPGMPARRDGQAAAHELPDVSLSGWALDSFFKPQGPLRKAEALAAEAFGAQATFFLACGTSVTNRAVLDALSGYGPMLIDSMSHQSVFFAVQAFTGKPSLTGDRPDEARYIPTVTREGTRYTDIGEALRMLAEHRTAGRPFGVIALNAASYDGHRLRLADILPAIAAASPGTVVFIDEAWSAIHTFSPPLARHSALPVIRDLTQRNQPAPTTVVTHSAHKTMHALRQGSYLHVVGSTTVAADLRDAIVRNHTTSPSWPILASLDVARAHAASHGEVAVAQALRLRELFVAMLRADDRVAHFLPRRTDAGGAEGGFGFHVADPMKLWLTVGGRRAGALRRYLYDEHRVYLARSAPSGLLAHFHIGVSEEDVRAFAAALVAWERRDRPITRSSTWTDVDVDPVVGAAVADYVLPYPPGVPIARPGEIWTEEHAELLAAERAAGTGVIRIRHR